MTSISNKKKEKITLKEEYDQILNSDFYGKEKQQFLLKKELLEKNNRSNQFDFLYPHLDDPEFNIKIAQKKEFNENKYDGSIYDLEEYSNKLCNADFELNPHQIFVRNFLSFNTPYNSLLLYHGLGTGKTCSAITVAEEMRDYLKQLKIFQRIIVVASPNVQENFKLQLFDERKLELINNTWTIHSNCVGNKFLKELNPTNTNISKQKLVSQIKRLINESYLFMGYREFAGYIHKVANIEDAQLDSAKITKFQKKKLQKIFNNRLVIIDEVHNIRLLGTSDKHDKKIANSLTKLVKYTDNMRLLLLSGTPMYNHYSEIIWLINLMNLNDNRSAVGKNDIFDKYGNFIKDKEGNEIGKDLFIHKITGYVSFIRGENPYIFPYRIYPELFDKEKSLKSMNYPRLSLNSKPIENPIQYMDLYLNKLHPYQENVYKYIIDSFVKNYQKKKDFEDIDRFGYDDLQYPLEALNIVYPIEDFNPESKISINKLVGKNGLQRILNVHSKNNDTIRQYEYKNDIEKKFGRIFSLSEINKYSSKIFSICTNILNSDGVVLVYSQYIEGGLIPMALALEELGFSRYGESLSIFKDTKNIKKNNMKYVMITGNIAHSKDNVEEIKAATNIDNIYGEKVKVILISRAGSEGIDFKYIRQVHILEPWYNTSRLEQIIGRAIRSKSHCDLPFKKRNVQLFLHGTITDEEETADLYIYRVAESKAITIGKVSRVLKETCVDCIVHHSQINFTEDKFKKNINIELSNKKNIEYNVGDKPFTNICDFMSECSYECKPDVKIDNINLDTYDKNFHEFNNDKIIKRIKLLFKDHYFMKKKDIINYVQSTHNYPLEHILSALDELINNKNEYLLDRFGNKGKLVNIDEYYLFQPSNIVNEKISIYDRSIVPYYKNNSFEIVIDKDEVLNKKNTKNKAYDYDNIFKKIQNSYNIVITEHKNIKGNKDREIALSKVYHLLKIKIDNDSLNKLVIDYILDHIPFYEKLIILNKLYFQEINDFELKLKKYFDRKILNYENETGIYLYNEKISDEYKSNTILLIKQENQWNVAGMTDNKNFVKLAASRLKDYFEKLNKIIGYTSYIKKNDIYVFKIIDLKSQHKKRGKRCDQSGKSDIIKLFNDALDSNEYNTDNTKNLTSLELCSLQEMMFRYYTLIKKSDKMWFLDSHDSYLLELNDWKLSV